MSLRWWLGVLIALLAVAYAVVRQWAINLVRYSTQVHVAPLGDDRLWGKSPALRNISNRPAPPFVTGAQVRALTNGSFEHRASDVWVTTYPCSGTTWTMAIVGVLSGHEIQGTAPRHEALYCPWPERGFGPPAKNMTQLKAYPSPRCFKTHWDYSDFMAAPGRGRVIFVMRNALDTLFSYHDHYSLLYEMFKFDGSFEDFFQLFVAGDLGSGSYFKYVASWWPRRHDPEVLWLRYEDMRKDTPGHIRRIAEFIGLPLTDRRLLEVQEATSMEAMRRLQRKQPEYRYLQILGLGGKISKGRVGTGKQRLSAEQFGTLERLYNETLLPLGVPREWALGQ